MNSVNLVGRLVRDPEIRYTDAQLAVSRITVAVDRRGKDKGADFISVIVFGKQAENLCKFMSKGRQVGITGHIQTGSYQNKDGNKVYTTDVIANEVQFLGGKGDNNEPTLSDIPEGFEAIEDDDIPF